MSKNKEAFAVVIPPPNVTGVLHMGHALDDTLQDILIRYNRMLGKKVLWQPGMDHAGIATQMVVERNLAKEGITRHDLGREKFVETVWKWKEQSGGTICRQLRRLGASCDWSRERFTMDEGLSRAVRKIFVNLYKDGLIYKAKKLVNWDSKFMTAVSDLEVVQKETPSAKCIITNIRLKAKRDSLSILRPPVRKPCSAIRRLPFPKKMRS